MANKRTVEKQKARRLILGVVDQRRLAALRQAMAAENAAVRSDADVIRVALSEAVAARGIGELGEQLAPGVKRAGKAAS